MSYLVFNTRIFTLGILTDENSVDIVVGRFEALDRGTRTNIGKKIERSTERQVEGDMAFANLVENEFMHAKYHHGLAYWVLPMGLDHSQYMRNPDGSEGHTF